MKFAGVCGWLMGMAESCSRNVIQIIMKLKRILMFWKFVDESRKLICG
jgi:hypothetical protein